MRKRIAFFANGWGGQFLHEVGSGIRRCAIEKNMDLFSFVDYCSYGGLTEENNAELNIFRLPDLNDFDGVILAPNSFNIDAETDFLLDAISKVNIPAVSLEYDLPGMPSVGTDNYTGMYNLANHLFKEHDVQDFIFINGFRNHMEAEVRLQAIRAAADNFCLSVPDENVLYADWSAKTAVELFDNWLNTHDLPDAIICANDIMALGIYDWLFDKGYSVPDDIILTGYDCLSNGQKKDRALTTVSHNWDDMGYKAMQTLYNQIIGEDYEQKIVIPTKFVQGKSCGCMKGAYNSHFQKESNWSDIDTHFRRMYRVLRKVSTAEELNKNLSEFLHEDGEMEGDDFMLCLHPNFFDYADEGENMFKSEGFYEPMDAVCAMHKGSVRKRLKMSLKRSMFQNAESSNKPVNNIFVTVRSDSYVYGYAMLSIEFDIVRDNLLYIWTRHMNQYIEQINNNVKLDILTKKLKELSITDSLTGVYNRLGCKQIIEPKIAEIQEANKQGLVLLIDIDCMKIINDDFGHVYGDLALLSVVSSLREASPENYMISRFGGDEFLVAGEYIPGFSIDEIIENIETCLNDNIDRNNITFPLSVSVGAVLLEIGEKFEFEKCIRIADNSLYKMKEAHHKKILSEYKK